VTTAGHTIITVHRAPDDGPFVDELFDALVSLPLDAREEALKVCCADTPDVAEQVRALLSAADSPPDQPVPAPGAMVGRYRLDRALGTGATASVWLAFDTLLRGHSALKLLDPRGPVGKDALGAALHEARAASAILSDHVVRVKSAGRFDDGPHFIEMELVAEHRPGEDGREVLEIGHTLDGAGLTDVREMVRLVAEAARGVDAAHRVGVLHRDLKPNNILVTPVSRHAKVTDFGLAAAELHAYSSPSADPRHTVTVAIASERGRIVGTPAYMAPEQAFGEEPTRACDIYALGATLYALLADRPPYVPDLTHPMPALEVLEQVRRGPPPRLRGVPARLSRIAARAMRRLPAERYATAADLAADLERYLEDRPASVDAGRPLLSLALYAKRNRRVLTTALVLLALVGVLAWVAAQMAERIVTLRQDTAEAQATLTGALAQKGMADEVTRLAKAATDKAVAEREAAEKERARALRGASAATARQEAAETARAEEWARRLDAEETAAKSAASEARSRADAEAAATALADAERALRASQVANIDLERRIRELEAAVIRAEQDARATRAERDAIAAMLKEARAALAAAAAAPPPPEPAVVRDPAAP
jgi:serine/threonine-protein kinase